uniref:Uncharacterized protein n=1 Tax=Eutreptiella gymnastica TaxID=73025 RepID=A0A7S4C7D7_9EUGL
MRPSSQVQIPRRAGQRDAYKKEGRIPRIRIRMELSPCHSAIHDQHQRQRNKKNEPNGSATLEPLPGALQCRPHRGIPPVIRCAPLQSQQLPVVVPTTTGMH